MGLIEGSRTEISEVGVSTGVPEDVVCVKVAVIDLVRVEVVGSRGDTLGNGKRGDGWKLEWGGVDVASAGLEGGRQGEGLVGGVDEIEHKAFGLTRVASDAAVDGDEVGVRAGGKGGLHLGSGEAVTSDSTLEEFDSDGLRLVPEGAVDGAGGTFA